MCATWLTFIEFLFAAGCAAAVKQFAPNSWLCLTAAFDQTIEFDVDNKRRRLICSNVNVISDRNQRLHIASGFEKRFPHMCDFT